mgnify:CR=1 FL=1
MAKSNTKITYDKEEDILNLSRGNPSKASIEVGDFILDIDFDGFVSAIEILNASENLGIGSEVLQTVESARMTIVYKPNYLLIGIMIKFKGAEKEVRIPLTIDLGHRQVQKQEVSFASI